MLNILHYPNFYEYNKMYISKIENFQKAHLVSFSEDGKVYIAKSRWFTGEYPHTKDGTHYVVDVETYGKIVQDTINIYMGRK
jgi:hypothetical protein